MKTRWIGGVIGAVVLWGTLAVAGEVCVTVAGSPATHSAADYALGERLAHQGDLQALQLLVRSGRVFTLKGGVRVYVEESSGWYGYRRIRPEGQLGSVYTTLEGVTCP